MFHWICPECGQEIAPTARECPVCDPPAVQPEPALVGVVEAPTARAANGEAPTARAVNGDAPAAHEPVPALAGNSDREPHEAVLPQFGESEKQPDPLGVLAATLEPLAPAIPPQKNVPTAAGAVPIALRALIAELGTTAEPPRLPVNGGLHPHPASEPPPVRNQAAMAWPNPVSEKLKPFGAKLFPLPRVLANPRAPGTPRLGLAPALASLTRYDPLEGRPLRPAQPARDIRRVDCGPRLTLAGPTLIPSLNRFDDRVFNPIPAVTWKPLKRFLPGWAMTASIACTILAAGINGVFSGAGRSSGNAQPAVVEAAPSNPVPPPPNASPLAKAIEVTGFRIRMEPGKKSEIQYLVINHTANALSGVTVYVTLYGAHAPAGQAPLGRFQFVLPELAAYQSKEMSAAIARVTRPVSLPEWQDLRADLEIGQ